MASADATEELFNPSKNITNIIIAHGVMASLAWVIIFPTGAILLRIAPCSNIVKTHAAVQILGYTVYTAAFGMGMYMATQFDVLNSIHPIIGIVVFVLASIQPISGLLHHLGFKNTQHRNAWSVIHLTFGRVAIILGIVNGGIELQQSANAPTGAFIAYGIVAGLFGVSFLIAMILGERRHYFRKRTESTELVGDIENKSSSQCSGVWDSVAVAI